MSEELETLLHEQADGVSFEPVDVTAVTRAGRRQVRRRRGAAVLGTVAVLAVAGTGAGVLAGGHHGGGDAADPTPPPQVSWASGSTIHQGSTDIDVGHTVVAYVRTHLGYVFTDGKGKVYSEVGGDVTTVGQVSAEDPTLVSDADGTTAGWVDPAGATAVFQVVDQVTGKTSSFGAAPGTTYGNDDSYQSAYFYALDGDTAYWHDASGAVATDLENGSTKVVDAGTILAAQDGRIVTVPPGKSSPLRVSGAGTDVTIDKSVEGLAHLSPDNRWLAGDEDTINVWEVSTGKPVHFDLSGYSFADAIGWLDAQTIEVFAQKTTHDDFQLFTCTVPDGHCTLAEADLGSGHESNGRLAIPVGQPIGV